MKVLDLFCGHGHGFEGWFGSEDDYQSQQQRGLVQCPLCGSSQVRKGLSAPRLNLGARPAPGGARHREDAPAPGAQAGAASSPQQPPAAAEMAPPAADREALRQMQAQLQAAWLKLSREIAARTEDVGSRFADEARRMHHGDIAERSIRGEATREQAMELLEEGVPVMPLALPVGAKETLQ
ncbi:DUF1178 family protein [Acidovorax sp. FG27]|uniref:DUF1178 family protein n=1 Tax=Acidovorax sp. FG27 TaxID=3133652 RepID=UPI0030E7B9A6